MVCSLSWDLSNRTLLINTHLLGLAGACSVLPVGWAVKEMLALRGFFSQLTGIPYYYFIQGGLGAFQIRQVIYQDLQLLCGQPLAKCRRHDVGPALLNTGVTFGAILGEVGIRA